MAAMFGKKRESDLSLNSLIEVNKGLKIWNENYKVFLNMILEKISNKETLNNSDKLELDNVFNELFKKNHNAECH